MNNKPTILFASTHWKNNSHHSNYSGYQRIALYFKEYYEVTLVTWGNNNVILEEEGIRIVILKSIGKTFFKKRNLISKFCKKNGHNYDLVYLLYADIGLRLNSDIHYISAVHNLASIGRYKSIKEQVVLWLKHNVIEPRVYQKSQKIICVSKNIQEILVNEYPQKACYIPHGIDVHFWKKDDEYPKANIVLGEHIYEKIAVCVGINGVNLEQVKLCIQYFPNVLFCLVGSFDLDYPNIKILQGISDEDLKALYNLSDVFFRPLDFATANNSLLEAMAMEKKIVITNTGGVPDYVSNDYVYLVKENNSNFIATLKEALEDKNIPPKFTSLRVYTVAHFAWEVIVEQTVKLFQ